MGFEVDFDSASPGIYIEKSGETVRKIVKHCGCCRTPHKKLSKSLNFHKLRLFYIHKIE
jgi:hypothetical protein